MPRAPSYNPNQVGPAETTGARFRTPDFGPPAVAQGLAGFGQAVNQFAIEEDQRDAEFDDTQSRKLATNALTELQGITNEYTSLQGGNATAARKSIDERLVAMRTAALGQTANERQKRMLGERLDGLFGSAMGTIDKHYRSEEFTERLGTFATESAQFANSAAMTDDADAAASYLAQGKATFQDGLRLKGVTDPEAVAFETLKFTDGAHTAKIDRWMANPEPPIDLVQSYVEAHKDEMTGAGYTKALERIQAPLQDRADYSLYAEVTAGAQSTPAGLGGATYKLPVAGGRITSKFGAARGSETHSGTDIAAPAGTEIRPIAGGTIEAVTQDARAGKWVKVKHADGTTSTYAHMGSQSVKVGDQVTGDTVLGVVGMTGRTTGPHVHLVVRDGKGNRVDPEKVFGGDAGTDNAPRQHDKAAIYNAIEGREGISFEQKERLKRIADREIARDEQLLSRQYKDAGDKALQTIIGLGDNFTDVGQIPQSIRNAADPSDVLRWQDAARKNKEAKAAIPKDNQRSLELQILQRADPDAFLRVDLSKEVGKVAGSELQSFALKQAELIGKGGKEKAYEPREKIKSAITWGAKYGGVDVDDKDFPKVYDAMDAYLKGVYAKKGALDASDYDAAFRGAVREIPRAGVFGGSMKAYDVVRVDQIPDGANATIDRTFRAANGRGPNDVERLTLYRQMLVNAGAR